MRTWLLLLSLLTCSAFADDSVKVRLSLTAEAYHGQGYWSPTVRIDPGVGIGLRIGTMRGHPDQPDVSFVELDKEFCYGHICGGLGGAHLSHVSHLNGTKWNFGLHARYQVAEHWSLVLDHYSHGRFLGIAKDKSNRGWNLLGVAYDW